MKEQRNISAEDLHKIAKGDFEIEDYNPYTGLNVCILLDGKRPIDLPNLEDWYIIKAGEHELHLHEGWGSEEKLWVVQVGLRSFEDWFVYSLHGTDKEDVMKTAIKMYAQETINKVSEKLLDVINLYFKPSLQVA